LIGKRNANILLTMTKPFIVKSLEQLRTVAAPGREEIVDAVELIGPCTARELAAFLGRSRHSLYYHLRALTRVGLLKNVSALSQGKRESAQYDVPGRPMIVRYDLKIKGAQKAVINLGKARFRNATRGFVRACNPQVAVTQGPLRNLWVAHWKGWLSATELKEVNQLFLRILKVFRAGSNARHGRRPHELTFAIAPVIARFSRTRGDTK
jgi:predicted transcriptional regulator